MKLNKGDIYKIGNHVIACGDSTDRDFVGKVIGKNKVRAIISDPPYGVAYIENKKRLFKTWSKRRKGNIGRSYTV